MAHTQFYLCSMWAYTADGARYIIEGLKDLKLPGATYVYEPNEAWFKVTCFEQHCISIEEKFFEMQEVIELDISADDVSDQFDASVGGLAIPHLFRFQAERTVIQSDDGATADTPMMTSASTKNKNFREWTKLADAKKFIPFGEILPKTKFLSIQKDSGANLEWDVNMRVISITAETEFAVMTAERKLDAILEDYNKERPKLQHLLWSEGEISFCVDARSMREVNPAILTSTIVTSSKIPLPKQYSLIYTGAATLRLCQEKVSMFGPRAQGVFEKTKGRAVWSLYHNYAYPSKTPDPTIAQPVTTTPSVPSEGRVDKDGQVQDWIDRIPETKSMVVVSQSAIAPSVDATGASSTTESVSRRVPTGDSPIPLPLATPTARPKTYQDRQPLVIHENQAHLLSDEQLRQAREMIDKQLASRQPNTQQVAETRPDSSHRHSSNTVRETGLQFQPQPQQSVDIGHLIGDIIHNDSAFHHTEGNIDLLTGDIIQDSSGLDQEDDEIDLLTGDVIRKVSALNHGDDDSDGDLIDLDDSKIPVVQETITFGMEPLVPAPPVSPQLQFPDEMSSREFHTTMNQQASSKAGRKRVKASKIPAEPSFSILTTEALSRIVEPMRSKVGKVQLKVEFGRIYLIDIAQSALATNKPGEPADPWPSPELVPKLDRLGANHIFFTKALTNFGNDAEFMMKPTHQNTNIWLPDNRYVVYELKCSHLTDNKDFIIKIHGDTFEWTIRSEADVYPPVLVHCLQRQWDFRFALYHTPTDELTSRYGSFAKEIVASLTVPPDNRHEKIVIMWDEQLGSEVTVNEVRVHHVARCRTRDNAAYFDMVQIQDMEIDQQPCGNISRHKAVSSPRLRAINGHFPIWYEASMYSARAEELFAQNEHLQHGEQTEWTVETFRNKRVFENLAGRATEMVRKIDGVGVFCDNGLGSPYGLEVDKTSGEVLISQSLVTPSNGAKSWNDEAYYY